MELRQGSLVPTLYTWGYLDTNTERKKWRSRATKCRGTYPTMVSANANFDFKSWFTVILLYTAVHMHAASPPVPSPRQKHLLDVDVGCNSALCWQRGLVQECMWKLVDLRSSYSQKKFFRLIAGMKEWKLKLSFLRNPLNSDLKIRTGCVCQQIYTYNTRSNE